MFNLNQDFLTIKRYKEIKQQMLSKYAMQQRNFSQISVSLSVSTKNLIAVLKNKVRFILLLTAAGHGGEVQAEARHAREYIDTRIFYQFP